MKKIKRDDDQRQIKLLNSFYKSLKSFSSSFPILILATYTLEDMIAFIHAQEGARETLSLNYGKITRNSTK